MSTKESMRSIIEFWQQIITDEEMPVQNRMKASELLYRSLQQQEDDTKETSQESQEVAKRIAQAKAIIAKYAPQMKGEKDEP